MAKVMMIVGVVLAAVAIALGVVNVFAGGSMAASGFTPEVAALLLLGGVLSVGMGGIIAVLEAAPPARSAEASTAIASPPPAAAPQFNRRVLVPEAAAAPAISPEVHDTIAALEKAKSDIQQALGEEPKVEPEPVEAAPVAEPPPPEPAPAAVEEAPVAEAVAEEPPAEEPPAEEPVPEEEAQLYIVEERTIRDRPARILSDGTVEAETDEGWMRFENLEHLDEYLDAMSPGR
jgi:hypothetical protein